MADRWAWIAAAICGIFVSCSPESPSSPESPLEPGNASESLATTTENRTLGNQVLVLIDTLRTDHLPFYGYSKDTAPYLNRLAKQGVIFTQAHSTSSWTAPSSASVFTGLYPPQHGITQGFHATRTHRDEVASSGRDELKLRGLPESPTLPELMREAGYRTLAVTGNVNISAPLGFDRGFEHFEHFRRATADWIRDRVLDWHSKGLFEGPYFLYLHVNDAHMPYEARSPWYQPHEEDVQDALSRYDSEIRYLDQILGELHETLGWEQDTLVTVVSDHGEEFMDHGQMGHKYSLYRELNDAVFLFHQPQRFPGNRQVSTPVSLVDVLPTLLDAAGNAVPLDRVGRSLLPLLQGGESGDAAEWSERVLFAHREREPGPDRLWGAIRGPWKLIVEEGTEQTWLFHRDRDPKEQENVAEVEPDVVRFLGQALREFRENRKVHGTSTTIDLDAELMDDLEALGYTEDSR